MILKMVQDGHIAGRAMLFAGPPSTGKTAIALGESTPLSKMIQNKHHYCRHGANAGF